MTEFVGQILYKQLFAHRKSRLVDKTLIALVQGKRCLGRDRARGITVPQERLQLRKLSGNNHARRICIHSLLNIVQKRLRIKRCEHPEGEAYTGSASENSTALPWPGVTISPSHMTRWPRITVPSGQPVTSLPS
jgi:hypothetical protein